jgi:hypothetical protein
MAFGCYCGYRGAKEDVGPQCILPLRKEWKLKPTSYFTETVSNSDDDAFKSNFRLLNCDSQVNVRTCPCASSMKGDLLG